MLRHKFYEDNRDAIIILLLQKLGVSSCVIEADDLLIKNKEFVVVDGLENPLENSDLRLTVMTKENFNELENFRLGDTI